MPCDAPVITATLESMLMIFFLEEKSMGRLLRRAQLLPNRQLANPLAAGGKDGVGQRGHHARGAGLSDAARRFQALDDVHVDLRYFVDAQHTVVAEVGLLHAAVLDGDLAVQR